MNIQSNDDARTSAGRPPGRGERTERNGPATSLRERDAQESVDGWSRQDSDDGERSCRAEQADSVQRAFSGAEEEYSDWEFALTCFVGTMDGTLLTELRAVAANPRVKRVPTDEAGNERARMLYNILALLTTKGPRKMVREVPDRNGYEAYRSLVLRYGSRDAHGETALLIKVMNFNFGDIDAMETKFKEFNLLIKEHDDISGIDNFSRSDQVSHSCGKSAGTTANPLAVEQSVVHNIPRDASGNQSVDESAQRFQTHGAT